MDAAAPLLTSSSSVVNNFASSTTVKNAYKFEVKCPLPLTRRNRKNLNLPTQLTPINRSRLVSIEIHQIDQPFNPIDAAAYDDVKSEIVYVRIMERHRINPAAMVKEHIINPIAQRLLPDTNKNSIQESTVNFFTGARRRNFDDDDDNDVDDADSVMKLFKDHAAIDGAEEDDRWHPKYKIPLKMFNIVDSSKKHRNVIVVSFTFKNRSTQREFIFDSEDQANVFRHIVNVKQSLVKTRAKARLKRALNGIQLQKNERLTFLIDICSGSDIPQAGMGGKSDPYVTVSFEGRLIHKTSSIPNAANPIWTLRKRSLFIWKVDALELFESHPGLVFEVKDYDIIGGDESLGAFSVNAHTLYKWPQNERKVFKLKPLPGEKDWRQGRIALQVRRATEYDVQFMEKYNSKQKTSSPRPKMTNIKKVLTKNSRKQKDGTREYQVRPGPDPNRLEATTWLTKDKLDEESLKESYEWLDIGSGNLGKIFVEVIKCDNLLNMDSVGAFGSKTDAFASLVYEDCMASTDVISNCLSPRWMPWSQRAFIFNMMHTSSQLFVAIFDSDRRVGNHDLCGRVSIDLSNCLPDTVYLLDYNLFPSAKSGPREAKYGTITIRLRLELADERVLLLSNMKTPQSVYVSVHTKKDFHVLRQTVEGNLDTKEFSFSAVKSHCDELYSYLVIYYYMEDAFTRLLLWRGGKEVFIPVPGIAAKPIKWISVRFPVSSLIAFLSLINLIEKPDLIPSFFFASIGWLLVETAGWRREHPRPWTWCKNFQYFLFALVFGKVPGPHKIDPNQWADAKAKAIHSYDYWEARVRRAEEKAKQRTEEYKKEQEEYLRELEEMPDMTATEELVEYSSGFKVDPIRSYLFPIQQYLGVLINWARFVKNILMWEESYISFLISMICFILSFTVFFVPWAFCIKWGLRILVWVAFGPWMKFVDIFYFSKFESSDYKKELKNNEKERKNKEKLKREKKKQEARLKLEKVTKLRDFKQYMFGEKSLRVNILKSDRYYDMPLDSSSATPCSTIRKSLGNLAIKEAGYGVTRIVGQQLEGEIIPRICDVPINKVRAGQVTKWTELFKSGTTRKNFSGKDDSLISAAMILLAGAGSVAMYGIKILSFVFRLVTPK